MQEQLPEELRTRSGFLQLAVAAEGAVLLLALTLGWLSDASPLNWLAWNGRAVAVGLLAAVPMFGLFLVFQRVPLAPLVRIRRFLIEVLGPPLDVCRWYDIVWIAAAAGLCEEAFFRGFLQQWLEPRCGFVWALAVASVVFGVLHMITPTYAVLATAAGAYLGWLVHVTGPPNLVPPIIAHAVYDYLALVVVVREYRRERSATADK